MISASALSRVRSCPGSEHLPHARRENEHATTGTILHKFLQDCNEVGLAEALSRVPAEHRPACALIGLESLPVTDGTKYAAEVAFAFCVDTFTAREIGRGLNRDYSSCKPSEIPMTADVVGLCEDAVLVADYKTGWSWQEPDSLQLKANCVAAAGAYRKPKAVAITVIVHPGADPVYLRHDMDEVALAQAAVELAHVVTQSRKAGPHDLTTGAHCRYCPALSYCPAQVKLVKDLAMSAASPLTPADMAAQLTPQSAREAWLKLKAAKSAIDKIDEAIRLFATTTPVDLGNGKWLGPKASTTESLDAGKAMHFLKEKYGDDAANAVCELKATKSALEDWIKVTAVAKGKKASEIREEVMAGLKDAGAIRTKASESVTEYAKR